MKKLFFLISCITLTHASAMTEFQNACMLKAKALEESLVEDIRQKVFSGPKGYFQALAKLKRKFPANSYIQELTDDDAGSITTDIVYFMVNNQGKLPNVTDVKLEGENLNAIKAYYANNSLAKIAEGRVEADTETKKKASELYTLAQKLYIMALAKESKKVQTADDVRKAFYKPYSIDQWGIMGLTKTSPNGLPKDYSAFKESLGANVEYITVGMATDDDRSDASLRAFKAGLEIVGDNNNKTYDSVTSLVLDNDKDCSKEFYTKEGKDSLVGNPALVTKAKLQRDSSASQGSATRVEKGANQTKKLNLGTGPKGSGALKER